MDAKNEYEDGYARALYDVEMLAAQSIGLAESLEQLRRLPLLERTRWRCKACNTEGAVLHDHGLWLSADYQVTDALIHAHRAYSPGCQTEFIRYARQSATGEEKMLFVDDKCLVYRRRLSEFVEENQGEPLPQNVIQAKAKWLQSFLRRFAPHHHRSYRGEAPPLDELLLYYSANSQGREGAA